VKLFDTEASVQADRTVPVGGFATLQDGTVYIRRPNGWGIIDRPLRRWTPEMVADDAPWGAVNGTIDGSYKVAAGVCHFSGTVVIGGPVNGGATIGCRFPEPASHVGTLSGDPLGPCLIYFPNAAGGPIRYSGSTVAMEEGGNDFIRFYMNQFVTTRTVQRTVNLETFATSEVAPRITFQTTGTPVIQTPDRQAIQAHTHNVNVPNFEITDVVPEIASAQWLKGNAPFTLKAGDMLSFHGWYIVAQQTLPLT
jgi:hypothetical protein